MKTVAIIQARMGSTRLPGKVMLLLGERSVLAHVVGRVMACPLLDAVVVATTTAPEDDAIANEAARLGAGVYRGSEHDVLSRYYEAATQAGADVVMRVTSDCPLIDPGVLEELLRAFVAARRSEQPCDYLSNTRERSYPRGLDAEVFTFAALERAHREARQPYEREHVTPYLYQHPELFHLCGHRNAVDISGHRWTLDTAEDWQLIQAIHHELGGDGHMITTREVLQLLQARPELARINAHIEQKKLGQ